jgi:predicted phosphodiesterase
MGINKGDSMIFIVGDIHGEFDHFWHDIEKAIDIHGIPDAIIQVGDFGYYTTEMLHWKNPTKIPVYFVDGNHEEFSYLPPTNGEIVEVRPELWYVPRGTVLELWGKKFAFCGGGESVDKAWRKEGISWFAEERVTDEDIQRTIKNSLGQKIDYLITHVPPISVIHTHFPKIDKNYWGLPDDWKDVSAMKIQALWDGMGNPNIIFGHMHSSIKGPNYQLLDCGEVLVV